MAKFFCPSKLSENISITPEGYLFCKNVPIARTGVMEYGPGETPLEVGADGLVYVSRTAEDLFNKKTIASFEGKSVTIRHPDDFVGPHNWKELTKGTLHNVRRGDEVDDDGEEIMLSDVLITEALAISLVKNGLREVSCGYEAEYEQTGNGKGKQTNIVGNHLALVEQGRAGNSYAIKDHNRKVNMKEKLQAMLALLSRGKTIDQALAEVEREGKKVIDIKKGKGKGKSKDGTGSVNEGTSSKSDSLHQMPTVDQEAYDELKKMFDALGEKLTAFAPKAKDESEEEEESEDEEVEQKEHKQNGGEDEGSAEGEILERVKVLEAALKKLLEGKAGDEAEKEEKEESKDSEEEEEEAEDEELQGEEGKKTGDAALAEIIAPGFETPAKGDIKVAALKAAMKDEKTAALIKSLNGGKAPTFDGKSDVNLLFHASAEILKARNGTGLQGTKSVDAKPVTFESFDSKEDEMTPEKMNEANAAHYAAKK